MVTLVSRNKMSPSDKVINLTIRRLMLERGLKWEDLASAIGCSKISFTNFLTGSSRSYVRRILIENELRRPFWSGSEQFKERQERLAYFGHEIEKRNKSGLRSLGQALGIFTKTELRHFSRKQFIERFSLHAKASIEAGIMHMEGNLAGLTQTFNPNNPTK